MNEQPLRVLLALDDASLRELFAKYLRDEYGYAVDEAATHDALQARIDGAQGQYDVVVLDDRLRPTLNHELELLGIALVAEIKARHPSIECILLADEGTRSGTAALRAGAHSYIRKPVDREELAIQIERAADQAAIALENAQLFAQAQEQVEQLGLLNRVSSPAAATRQLKALQRISRLLTATLYLHNILDFALEEALRATPATHGYIALRGYVAQRDDLALEEEMYTAIWRNPTK